MCYNVANYNTWREIFGINSTQDIIDTLTKWYNKINYHFDERYRSKCTGFCNDQYMLYKYVNFSPINRRNAEKSVKLTLS